MPKIIRIELSPSELKILQTEKSKHPNAIVRRKMEVVYLKSLGYTNASICKIASVSKNTAYTYIKQYIEGGISRLQEIKSYRRVGKLQYYSEVIKDYFIKNPPTSISNCIVKISELSGIYSSESTVRRFMKKLGFRFRKSVSVPSKSLEETKKKSSVIFWNIN
jgi:transposase